MYAGPRIGETVLTVDLAPKVRVILIHEGVDNADAYATAGTQMVQRHQRGGIAAVLKLEMGDSHHAPR